MKAEIICIGTELLLGHLVNTNQSTLSRKLAELGIDSYYQITVGDNPQRLKDTIKTSLSRSDIVITTGGLGPTVDDITTKAISQAVGKKLVFHKSILKKIENHFKRRNIKMPSENRVQAYIPEGSIEIPNKTGTAPGFIININKKLLITLPGPPYEMQRMMDEHVVKYLKKKLKLKSIIKTRTIRITGLAESQVNARVKDLLKMGGKTTVGIYAKPSIIELKITSKAQSESQANKEIKAVENKIIKRFGDLIFGFDGQSIEEVVGGLLSKKKKTLSVAESCTGGLVCDMITNVPGSSKYFLSGVIAYSNETKINILDVPSELIRQFGAVSEEVALFMAASMRNISKSDYALSVTGIAGPTGGIVNPAGGGSAFGGKPVGLVYIGLATSKKTIARKCNFTGERKVIKYRAAIAAIDLLRHELLK